MHLCNLKPLSANVNFDKQYGSVISTAVLILVYEIKIAIGTKMPVILG